ncbi:hypothetical protein NIES267_38070 [Calothrix parasitica NIES-267]|uniref:DUF928 domain-containing protein n=1 Tax=Calothrix parasitica NIES-267 TaxID=1973488 RepID=A0A1Z4LT26_9CYAN|nr:hypothetical protein NIES267_38070 [Calothrix parasitica NIES-267]
MNKLLKLSYKLLSIGLCSQLLLFVFSKSADSQQNISVITAPIQFEPPPDGEPPDTSGGGSRDPDQSRCSSNEEPIKALIPKGNFGWTLQEIPSIYVYLPKTSAKQVVLAFQDETEEYHETVFLPIKADEKVVSFSLPKDRPSLEIGKNYKWKLAFVCGDVVDVEHPQLEGWVKRIDVNSINTNLNDKTAIEQARWYAQNGYWYDLVKVLKEANEANPNDSSLNSLWINFLASIDIKQNRYNTIKK